MQQFCSRFRITEHFLISCSNKPIGHFNLLSTAYDIFKKYKFKLDVLDAINPFCAELKSEGACCQRFLKVNVTALV